MLAPALAPLSSGECGAVSGGRRVAFRLVRQQLLQVLPPTLRQRPVHLRQQLRPHLLPRRLVEPVEKPTAAGRLAQTLVDLEAGAGEELLDLADRLQAVPLP